MSEADKQNDKKAPDEFESESQSAAAQLTNLPLKWVVLMLLLCLATNLTIARVERSQLIASAEDKGLITQEEAAGAKQADRLVDEREQIRDRIRELKKKRSKFRRMKKEIDDGMDEGDPERESRRKARRESLRSDNESDADTDAPDDEIPLTLESVREDLIEHAGDSFPTYQKGVTVLALVIGALGLIVMALFVRVLGAAILGGGTFAVAWFMDVEPGILWGAAGVAALAGTFFAPRMLLANMLVNSAFALMIIGGVMGGGAVYLSTGDEFYALCALGGGALIGAIIGIKYARQLFLSAVLANCAGLATLALWLMWGELYANFWPLTFGALMIFDGVATRIYHKVRWSRQ
ncbi:hypothetical protein OAU50_05640 [Planctomycetota bacterium]|nr:hypothetical protein [Planctomycetota bacterium]